VDLEGVVVDPLDSVLPGLPGGPPVAAEVEVVGDLAGELGKRDAEGVCSGDGRREHWLPLAGLIAGQLANAHAGGPR
jgi:hypothetical protein